tara:strand:+ start:628 stop:909 length:282 start_codon:yes stop_codon:yes gene_type:complete
MFNKYNGDTATTINKRLSTLENKLNLLSDKIIKQVEIEHSENVNKSLMTKKEFSKISGISEHILNLEIENGHIKTTKRGGRNYISSDQLANYK